MYIVLMSHIFYNFYRMGTHRRGGSAADTLQQAMLPVAAHSECSRVNGRLLPVDKKSMVCAGGQGKGGCQVHCNYHELNFKYAVTLYS